MPTSPLTQRIKAQAHTLGFTLVGVTTADPPAHLDVLEEWLAAGRHGEMGYLATEIARRRRADPRRILPECRSILVLGIPYDKPGDEPPAAEDRLQGRVAAYAWGEDYHEALKPRLQELVAFIEAEVGRAVPNRWYTDTGPILERELAQRAGLGWIGKNSMLIHPQHGSYYLLAEILLGIELDADDPVTADHCGTCTRCLEACPTACILPDRTLDARRCISYLTIELKSEIPTELRSGTGDWVFGCDVCQQVCPWNARFAAPHGDPAFAPGAASARIDLGELLASTPQEFNRRFRLSPFKRPKRRGVLRNAAVALGNTGNAASLAILEKALQDSEPLVRGHAAWALGQIGDQRATRILRAALEVEEDVGVREGIEAALGVIA